MAPAHASTSQGAVAGTWGGHGAARPACTGYVAAGGLNVLAASAAGRCRTPECDAAGGGQLMQAHALTQRACRLIQPLTPPSDKKAAHAPLLVATRRTPTGRYRLIPPAVGAVRDGPAKPPPACDEPQGAPHLRTWGLCWFRDVDRRYHSARTAGYRWSSCARSAGFTSNAVHESGDAASRNLAAASYGQSGRPVFGHFGRTHVAKKQRRRSDHSDIDALCPLPPVGAERPDSISQRLKGVFQLTPITNSTMESWSKQLDAEIDRAQSVVNGRCGAASESTKTRHKISDKPWTLVCQRVLPWGTWGQRCARTDSPYDATSHNRSHDPFIFLGHGERPPMLYGKCHWQALRRRHRRSKAARPAVRPAYKAASPSKRQKRSTVMDELVLACMPLETQYQWWIKGHRPPLRVHRSHIDGLGVFVAAAVPKGRLLLEYCGEVVRKQLADVREARYAKQSSMSDGRTYMFSLDADHVVDATALGSVARFANHSCSPNCGAKVLAYDGDRHILLYANRDIDAGEELTYDYKLPYEKDRVRCFCNAANCRKYLN